MHGAFACIQIAAPYFADERVCSRATDEELETWWGARGIELFTVILTVSLHTQRWWAMNMEIVKMRCMQHADWQQQILSLIAL